MRAMEFGFQAPFNMTISEIDEELTSFGAMGERTSNRRFSFFHSLDVAISFAEQEHYTGAEIRELVEQLIEGKSFYDPLYLREILINQKGNLRGRSLAQAIAAPLLLATNCIQSTTSLDDEEQVAAEFLRQRQKCLVLPQKLVVHAVDGQASEKIWRTYEQVKQRTSKTLASIATYGLVTGGVVGGILPTILHGTIDRADLMIMNWYPQYQGAVLCPLESFMLPGHQSEFTHSMSVMIDDEKCTGTDIFVGPAENKLPYLEPSKFVVVAPTTLNVAGEAGRLAYQLGRTVDPTLNRCIFYNPALWGNFHCFNEWLQTTKQGNELLENKLGRKLAKMKTVDEIK